jgi:5,10-methylenetetrahydrofolate reductase
VIEELITKLRDDKYLTLETTPGHTPSINTLLGKLKEYDLSSKVDGFSATDSPLARLKYSALMASIKIQSEFDKPVICTMSMRDRNKIALQSDLLGANDFDIRAILALTGDPASMSDQPHTKGVFEGNSTLLMQMIQSFNTGMDFAGKPFKESPKPIYTYAVSNSYAKNFKTIEKKLYQKVKNYSVGIITQPVFDIDIAKKLIEIFDSAKSEFSDDRAKSQLILGVFPIVRLRTAQFLASHVPGIYVPDEWIEKLTSANKISEEEERKVGLELSKNLLADIQALHPKVHLMTANNFDLANELLD